MTKLHKAALALRACRQYLEDTLEDMPMRMHVACAVRETLNNISEQVEALDELCETPQALQDDLKAKLLASSRSEAAAYFAEVLHLETAMAANDKLLPPGPLGSVLIRVINKARALDKAINAASLEAARDG